MVADLEGEITGAQFAREARMIIAGMVNSQTVLLTIAPEPQPQGVQVVEWVGLGGNFSILSSEHIPEENNKVNNPQSDNIPRRIIHNHR